MIARTRIRLRRALQATQHELSGLLADYKLLRRRGNGHCSFRHSRMDGLDILVRADEDLGHDVYFFGEYEPGDSAFIHQQVREADVCVDIGANIGVYTLFLAKKASQGVVHAFEPVSLNYHVLTVNVLANKLPNVILNNCAIGDSNANIEFYVAQDGGFSSAVDTGRKRIVDKAQVNMMTLDSYCTRAGLPRVDVLKVDVEGGEPGVIRGAHDLLSDDKRRPRLIMLELYEPMLQRFGARINEVIGLMRGYRYTPSIAVAGELVPFTEKHHNTFYNVFFTQA
jgi:FkbM family methyltransferase